MTRTPDQLVAAAIVDTLNHWYLVHEDPAEWVRFHATLDGRVITVTVESSDVDEPATQVQLLITGIQPVTVTEPCGVGTMDQPDNGTAA